MNNKIDRTKTETARYGVRSIALVLFFVMLLTAIGSGSVLSAFAVAKSDAPAAAKTVAADDDVYAAAADEFDTEATMLSIAPEEEEEEPAVSLPQKKSGDIAVTGANVDLASTKGNAYKINYGVIVYFVNKEDPRWGNPKMHFWYDGGGDGKYGLSQISGTDVWYMSNSWDYNSFRFEDENAWSYTGGFNKNVTQNTVFWNSSDWSGSEKESLNGTPKIVSMVATTNGGTYTAIANSNCVATISSVYIDNNSTSTSSSSQSTGSARSTAQCDAAFGATISYSATATGDYVFKGFSTTNQNTLPSVSSSISQTSYYYRGYQTNASTVYAYFEKKPSRTATITSDDGAVGTEKSANASITTSSTTAGSATTASTTEGTTVYVYTNQNSGYKATVTAATTGGTTVSVTPDSAKKFHFTMPSSAVNVTVTYSEASYVPVRVYAGTGGSVAVVYNGATTNVSAGSNKTVRVLEGDSIDLTATAATNYTFSKWKKNLSDSYKTTAAITGETISDETVYVAVFTTSASSSDWIATSSSIDSTPQTANTNESSFRYRYGSSDTGLNTDLAVKKTGTSGTIGYWADFTNVMPSSSNEHLYFCLSASNYPTNDIVGTTSNTINTVNTSSTVTIKDSGGNTLFTVEPKTNGTYYNGNSRYMHITGVDTSKVAGIAVMTFFNDGGGHHGNAAHYQFYYKAKTSSGTDTSYSPGVTFYAKDCGLNESSTNNEWFGTDTDTTVAEKTDLVRIADSHDKYVTGSAVKGTTITVTTTIPNTGTLYGTLSDGTKSSALTARQKYYVAGYLFNGKTPKQLEWNSDGVYTCDYTIPADMTENYLEITPVYFIKDDYAYNTTVFYVQGYDDTVQSNGWGSTLFVYPYYKRYTSRTSGDTSYLGQAENFGAYSGQPLLNINGQIMTQIPLTDDGSPNGKDNNNPIKGMTISNGYYDKVHRDATGLSVHRQTYDYDDFAKIKTEKANVNGNKLHSIFYTFKFYESKKTDATQHRKYAVTSTYYGSNYKAYYSGGQADRYNDLFTTDGDRPGTGSSIAKSTLETYGTNTTGWEDLTDALGNKVDLFGNSVDTSKSELKVFSIGYEWNNAGLYATEWAVYAPTTATGTTYKLVGATTTTTASNSSIVPSALILNSSSRFTAANYPQLDGDQSITGYKDLYTALSAYKNYPVKISYEREVPSKNDDAFRCDGRWTYTTDKDFVQSNIIIEYDDKDGNQHRYGGTGDTAPDTFINTNQGENTGAKAYFTNTNYSGKVQSDSEEISNTAQYTFKAEEGGSYEFVGWYLYDKDGKVQPLSEDFEAKTTRSNNYTIAARFKYVASGKLKISAGLADGNDGRGTVYLGVAVKASGSSSYYDIANAATNTTSVTLDSDYINTSDHYTIKVTVRTVPTGENTFSNYSAYTTNDSDVRSAAGNSQFTTPDSGSGTATQEFEFTVDDNIFSGNNQIVKGLEYLASLTPVTYHYSIKFTYPSRQYGTQAFTAEGDLTTAQINDSTYVGGPTGGTGRYLTREFIQKIMPYESSFNKDINFTLTNVNATSYSGNTYTFSTTFAGVESTEDVVRSGYFYIPYEATISSTALTPDSLDAEADSVTLAAGVTALDETTYLVNKIDNVYDGAFEVTAPKLLTDGGTNIWYFSHWSIRTNDTDDGSSHEIARCYFPDYNYRTLADYDIYAIYSESEVNQGTAYNEATFTTVDFIGNNRNQWNKGENGSLPDTAYYAGDIIYNDFILSFKPEGNTKINRYNAETTQVGMVVQRLGEVQKDASGKAKSLAEHAGSFSASDLDAAKDLVTELLSAGSASSTDGATGIVSVKYAMNLENVNNKNRLHYAMPLYNSYQGTSSTAQTQYTNCKYLYRAYSYMKVDDGEFVISDTPTYFYMFDIANK